MTWMHTLYETAPFMQRLVAQADAQPPVPDCHTTARAHVEVVLTQGGDFLRARALTKDESTTCIPCTQFSGTRSGKKPVPHPLCDSLQYLAHDFRQYGGQVTTGFQSEPTEPHAGYMTQLRAWVGASAHPVTSAVLAYLEKGTLLADLATQNTLPLNEEGGFAKAKTEANRDHPLWNVLSTGQPPEGAVVRWRVESPGLTGGGCWEDQSLIDNWTDFTIRGITLRGLCMVTGETAPLATFHPAKLRNAADKAKLISANDGTDFTFRGRFTDRDGVQGCGVAFEVTQKAHSVLRWLIANQGYRNGSQAFVSWAVSGAPIPQPLEDNADWMDEPLDESHKADASIDHTRDLGASFALKLNRYLAGFSSRLDPTEVIVVLGLDSATPGRMSVIYYRELLGSEFLERLRRWHTAMAWPQRVNVKATQEGAKTSEKHRIVRVFAPSPRAIAEAAYGASATTDKDKKLVQATVERVLPCITDARPLPRDLMESCARRASNRASLKPWEWETALGVACAVFKGYYATLHNTDQRREYGMALEPDRTSRDYLFGRLLAIAEHIEARALHVGGEDRPTTALRLMQRFADHPASTWNSIRSALPPYMMRLQTRRTGFLRVMTRLMDEVTDKFDHDDFVSDRKLSGEYLLGYSCQRQALQSGKKDTDDTPEPQGAENEQPAE